MRKLKGYIPVEGEVPTILPPDWRKIDGIWFKETDVWVPGVNDLASKMKFVPSNMRIEYCSNCGARKDLHKGPNLWCPAKDEKQLPGIKHD